MYLRLVGENEVLEVYRMVGRMEEEEEEAWDLGWNAILRKVLYINKIIKLIFEKIMYFTQKTHVLF